MSAVNNVRLTSCFGNFDKQYGSTASLQVVIVQLLYRLSFLQVCRFFFAKRRDINTDIKLLSRVLFYFTPKL